MRQTYLSHSIKGYELHITEVDPFAWLDDVIAGWVTHSLLKWIPMPPLPLFHINKKGCDDEDSKSFEPHFHNMRKYHGDTFEGVACIYLCQTYNDRLWQSEVTLARLPIDEETAKKLYPKSFTRFAEFYKDLDDSMKSEAATSE